MPPEQNVLSQTTTWTRILWASQLTSLLKHPYQKVSLHTPNWVAAWQNQQNYLCVHRRLISAWASAQTDQSLLSAWRNFGSLATHWAHSEDTDQTCGCADWSESLLGTHVILLVLSCCSSRWVTLVIYNITVSVPKCGQTSESLFLFDFYWFHFYFVITI